jgi:predicted nucleotidyltransferase
VDLIIEFSKRVSLLTISSVKVTLEEMLNLDVDIVHGPLRETDLLEVEKVVELYAA